MELAERLRMRLGEAEEEVRARVFSISDVTTAPDPTYAPGLRQAVSVALDYAATAIVDEDAFRQPVPAALLLQARLAARNGVTLETVMRRYFAGYALLSDVLMEEAAGVGCSSADVKPILRRLSLLFDHLLDAISTEFQRERAGLLTPKQRRTEQVRRLLDGELIDATGLDYGLDGRHIAFVAAGPGGDTANREMATSLDCRVLLVTPDSATAWGWLGSPEALDPDRLVAAIRSLEGTFPSGLAMGCGEPGRDLGGWRLTHRQAVAALTVAQRGLSAIARYRDVALLAAALKDDLLTTSLRRLYLDPFGEKRDRGRVAIETLNAYFSSGGNTSSTAAALAVHRDTIASRLRSIEKRIGRPLYACAAELELALRLAEMSGPHA